MEDLNDQPDGPAAPPETTAEASRKMDEEIRLMGEMARNLSRLDPQTRARVVRWLADRYAS